MRMLNPRLAGLGCEFPAAGLPGLASHQPQPSRGETWHQPPGSTAYGLPFLCEASRLLLPVTACGPARSADTCA